MLSEWILLPSNTTSAQSLILLYQMLSICIDCTTTSRSHFNVFFVEFQLINICSGPDRLPYYVAHHDLRLLQTTIFLRISNILKSSRVLAQLCKWYIYLLWKRSCKCTYWSVSCRLHLDAVYCLIIAYWLSWIKIFRDIFIFQQNVIWRSQPCYSLVVTLVVSTFLKIRL